MARDLVTISAGDSCGWALRVMASARVRHLPVLDRNRLVGIVTENDIRRRAPQPVLPENVTVAGVMTYAPVTVEPSTGVSDAIRLLLDHDISALPVVKSGQLLGMFTRTEALQLYLEALDRRRLQTAAASQSSPPRAPR